MMPGFTHRMPKLPNLIKLTLHLSSPSFHLMNRKNVGPIGLLTIAVWVIMVRLLKPKFEFEYH